MIFCSTKKQEFRWRQAAILKLFVNLKTPEKRNQKYGDYKNDDIKW